MKRTIALSCVAIFLAGCETDVERPYDSYRRYAPELQRPAVDSAPLAPTDSELSATRKALYAAGYRRGLASERATYQRFGQLWPERLRRPVACFALPAECGEADGRTGFHTAVRDGYEPCVRPDTDCEPSAPAVARRRAEVTTGWNDGYSRRLAVYVETGARNPQLPAQGNEIDCRAETRECAFIRGWDDAGLAVEEGREACAAPDASCEQRRDAVALRDETLAPGERERMKVDEAARRRSEELYLSAKLKTERTARRQALHAQAMSLVELLESNETECTSTFGDKVLTEKPAALAEWDRLSEAARKELQAAVTQTLGEGAPNLAREAQEARHELSTYVPSLCLFGG
jgi:hypothetical protein